MKKNGHDPHNWICVRICRPLWGRGPVPLCSLCPAVHWLYCDFPSFSIKERGSLKEHQVLWTGDWDMTVIGMCQTHRQGPKLPGRNTFDLLSSHVLSSVLSLAHLSFLWILSDSDHSSLMWSLIELWGYGSITNHNIRNYIHYVPTIYEL